MALLPSATSRASDDADSALTGGLDSPRVRQGQPFHTRLDGEAADFTFSVRPRLPARVPLVWAVCTSRGSAPCPLDFPCQHPNTPLRTRQPVTLWHALPGVAAGLHTTHTSRLPGRSPPISAAACISVLCHLRADMFTAVRWTQHTRHPA